MTTAGHNVHTAHYFGSPIGSKIPVPVTPRTSSSSSHSSNQLSSLSSSNQHSPNHYNVVTNHRPSNLKASPNARNDLPSSSLSSSLSSSSSSCSSSALTSSSVLPSTKPPRFEAYVMTGDIIISLANTKSNDNVLGHSASFSNFKNKKQITAPNLNSVSLNENLTEFKLFKTANSLPTSPANPIESFSLSNEPKSSGPVLSKPLEETNKLAVEPEKPPNPNVAAEQPYDSKVTSEALIASSEQPIIMLASESPVASEQTLSPELSAMHSSRAPEKLVDMIINSEPPLYSETSAAPKELNIYLDTSTGSKADLSPYELNLETVNTDGPNDISEKPVELSAASPNESANKELVVEEINNPNSVSESPAESLTSASNQPAVTTKKEKETLSPSFYSLTSTSTTTEKAIYLPSMTAEPPMVSVVNKEESVPILWNSDNIAVHSNLSNSSADSEAHISANALEYFTTTQSPSTYYLQESTDSISTSHSISPSDLYAKLPDNNSSSELELNNTKSELVNLINADYPGISTLANTTYSDESASTATAANVAYTTISTGIVASYVLRKLNQFY